LICKTCLKGRQASNASYLGVQSWSDKWFDISNLTGSGGSLSYNVTVAMVHKQHCIMPRTFLLTENQFKYHHFNYDSVRFWVSYLSWSKDIV